MITTLRRLALTERARVLVVGAGIALFMLLMVVVYEQLGTGVLKGMDGADAISRGFDIRALLDADSVFANLIGVAFVHPFFLALTGMIAVGLGARSCAGELHDGTLELTLARPISRYTYLAAYGVFIAATSALTLAVVWVTVPLADRLLGAPGSIEAAALAQACVGAWMLTLALGSASMLLSVLARSRGQALGWSIGLIAALYFLEFFARMWDELEPLGVLSPFHWFAPTDVLLGGGTDWGGLLVLAGMTTGAYAIAAWRFATRDLV